MTASQIYITISIIVLIIIGLLVFLINKKGKNRRLTPLSGLAFAFVLAGIIFGDNRLTGYSLMGIGIILAVIDIIKKSGKK